MQKHISVFLRYGRNREVIVNIVKIILAATITALLTIGCTQTESNDSISTPINIFDEIRTLIAEYYFDRSQLPVINAALELMENNPNVNLSEELNRLFNSMQVSHFGFYTPDDLDYHELLGTFSTLYADKLRTMFPPDGIVKYPGIGIAPRLINGRYYAAFVYANTPAARAGILTGDELLTVDGQQYSPVEAFRGKVGETVRLALRRVRDEPVIELDIAVEAIDPMETLTASTTNSAVVIERDGHKLGYIRMYSYAGLAFGQILTNTISGGSFASADALILDIRGRWGGAPLDAAEVFIGGTPTVEWITAAGEVNTSNFRWTKPLVVIIGSETRSGLEIMAYSLKKAGIPLVGSTTAGAVIGGFPFLLHDGSFLMIPGMDVRVDGRRIEGVGVAPTVPVDTALEYSRGNDPKLEAAINKIIEILNTPQ
ncbi:MAG: hypothetical protein LBC70_10395 [Chitinispirillales bacterium]|nr:hypothetical protein [Chitinispirillales bacterium]